MKPVLLMMWNEKPGLLTRMNTSVAQRGWLAAMFMFISPPADIYRTFVSLPISILFDDAQLRSSTWEWFGPKPVFLGWFLIWVYLVWVGMGWFSLGQ